MTKKKRYTNISFRGGCGFAQSGRHTYLENTHKKKSFQVQVRTHFKYEGGRQGHTDKLHVVPAKSEISLGCSCTAGPVGSVTRYSFEIMNEVEMK